MNNIKKVLLVGLGLMGGSYAHGLSKHNIIVDALDINENNINYALNKKIINKGFTKVKKDTLKGYDLIIFCLYPKDIIDFLKANQDKISPNTTLTDISGIKGYLLKELKTFLRNDLTYISHHPMAGKEKSGIENSTSSIFLDANFLIIKDDEKDVLIIEELGKLLNFKRIVTITSNLHDEMIAFLSQLTHVIAIALMTSKNPLHLKEYSGDSFRDLTRIAKINETLWSELFILNKEELLKQIDLFMKQMDYLREIIENEDTNKLKEIMIKSTNNRIEFDK